MTRRAYLWSFVLVAATFVPVWFEFGLVAYWVPVSFYLINLPLSLISLLWKPTHLRWEPFYLVLLFYIGFFLAAFYLAGRLAYRLSIFPKSRALQWIVQILFLFALFSCSFLPVITYSSIAGSGGTYTFWSAIPRYLEKK